MGAKITSTDNEHLKGGEQRLVNALRAGEPCKFIHKGKGKEPDAARTLRGDVLGQLLRGELVEGETEPVKLGRAVSIEGAIITGILDMSDTNTGLALGITHSVFKKRIDFTRAKLALLNLEHSQTLGAAMEFLTTESHLWLDHIKCEGKFNIASAKIGGQFAAEDATFNNPDGEAISAQAAEIAGDVFLDNATVTGEADFNGAKIGGQFVAVGASFNAAGQIALKLFHANINGNVWLTDMPHPPIGHIDFTNAVMTHIVIDKNSLPLGIIVLDGTRYTNLTDQGGNPQRECDGWLTPNGWREASRYRAAFDALFYDKNGLPPADDTDEKRLEAITTLRDCLAEQKSHTRSPFACWQFSKVLDSNGHEREARAVRVLASRQYTQRTVQTMFKTWNNPIGQVARWCLRLLYRLWRWFLRRATGFGTQPELILLWLIGSWILSALVFHDYAASMTPSRETFYMAGLLEGTTPKPYTLGDAIPEGYPQFSPLIYALDAMLPIVDITQETHWRPRSDAAPVSVTILWFNRFLILWGWFLTTIGIAGFSGLFTDKREP